MNLKISDQSYRNWQSQLHNAGYFSIFIKFWGLYAVLNYAVFGLYILTKPSGLKIAFAATCAALFTRYVVCEFIELFYRKPHPYQRLNLNLPTWWLFSFTDKEHDAFPSQHTSVTMAISMVIYLFFPILGILGFITSAIMGYARIVLGFHEIIDVLAGVLLGLISGYFICFVMFLLLFTPH